MSKFVLSAVLLCASVTMSNAGEAIVGWWQTAVVDQTYGHVEVVKCGGQFCGILRRGYDINGVEGTSPDIGREVLTDVVVTGDGTYTGRAWRPEDRKVYDVRITVTGDRLEIKGCLVGNLLCQSSHWQRVQ